MPTDADAQCSPMREVYDRMRELGKMPYIRDFDKLVTSPDYDTCSIEIPKWIIVLRSAFKKFDCMETCLHYDKTYNFKIKSDTTSELQDAILSFSTDIFRCQALFPGQTRLCQHALKAWQHLNIICMHCRTYQMILYIKHGHTIDASQIPSDGADSEKDAKRETQTSKTAVLLWSQTTHKQNASSEGVVAAVIVRPPPYADAPPAYTDKTDKPTLLPAPTAPSPWSTDNRAKLEVQDLLQMLQTAASPRTNERFTF
jgi:hypothetical protein